MYRNWSCHCKLPYPPSRPVANHMLVLLSPDHGQAASTDAGFFLAAFRNAYLLFLT